MINSVNSLANSHAFVTGGGRGIGSEITRFLLQAGAKVSIVGRDSKHLDAMVKTKPSHCFAHVTDISDPASVQSAFSIAKANFGPIHILVNNAGQALSAPFMKTDLAMLQQMLNVNLIGTMLCSQAALPDMIENGWGRIINIASTAGITGYPYVSAYCASKHAVVGMTRALALEIAQKNVTVNAICPGFTESDILRESIENVMKKTGRLEADVRSEFSAHNPQGKIIQPSEIATAVIWLCSQESGSIHGQTIPISGGELF